MSTNKETIKIIAEGAEGHKVCPIINDDSLVSNNCSLCYNIICIMKKDLCKKSIVLFLAAILISAAALSFYYISAEAFHECEDNRCPICKTIQISESITSKSSLAVAAEAAAVVFLFTEVFLSHGKALSQASESLITMKVRLNN